MQYKVYTYIGEKIVSFLYLFYGEILNPAPPYLVVPITLH